MKITHEKCMNGDKGDNCSKLDDNGKCVAYANPSYWWDHVGHCPLASHVSIGKTTQEKVRVGQQKQRKRI